MAVSAGGRPGLCSLAPLPKEVTLRWACHVTRPSQGGRDSQCSSACPACPLRVGDWFEGRERGCQRTELVTSFVPLSFILTFIKPLKAIAGRGIFLSACYMVGVEEGPMGKAKTRAA